VFSIRTEFLKIETVTIGIQSEIQIVYLAPQYYQLEVILTIKLKRLIKL